MGTVLVLDILMNINGVISTVLNFVVIYMVLFKSPLDIKSYKWFLLNNAVSNNNNYNYQLFKSTLRFFRFGTYYSMYWLVSFTCLSPCWLLKEVP